MSRIDQAQNLVNYQRGLNYLFSVKGNQPSVFDAATVGNPTRCVNHPIKTVQPNTLSWGRHQTDYQRMTSN